MKQKEHAAKAISTKERMRGAGISDATRDYLVLLGKLYDAYDEVCSLIERDYGSTQVDSITKRFSTLTSEVNTEIEMWLIRLITEHIGDLDCRDI